ISHVPAVAADAAPRSRTRRPPAYPTRDIQGSRLPCARVGDPEYIAPEPHHLAASGERHATVRATRPRRERLAGAREQAARHGPRHKAAVGPGAYQRLAGSGERQRPRLGEIPAEGDQLLAIPGVVDADADAVRAGDPPAVGAERQGSRAAGVVTVQPTTFHAG